MVIRRAPYYLILGHVFCLFAVTTTAQDFQISLEIVNPNPVGSGARALGMGNTFIAVADDATAASWNPAGLLQLQLPEFSFAVEALSQSGDIDSRSSSRSENQESLNLADFNYASVVFPFHLGRNMVFSLNYLKLFRFDNEMQFPIVGEDVTFIGTSITEANHNFDQDGTFSVLAPAFAVSVLKNLSLGIAANFWSHDVTQSSQFKKKETTVGEATVVDSMGNVLLATPINDTQINDFEIDEGYSFVLGALYRLNEHWDIGVVIKPEFGLDLDQDITMNNFKETRSAELDMPTIIGAGVSWRRDDSLTVSTDVTWTEWSEYRFVDKETDLVKNPLTGRSSDVDELENTFTVRVGCEYYLIRENYLVPFRFGLGYDPAPSVDSVDDFYTINVGAGIQVGPYNFDIGYEFRWGNNVNSISLEPVNSSQDVYRHRVLASLVYYF